jgi:hypothetical protein
MRGHLARSACEAAGARRKRLGGEAAHRFHEQDLYPVSVTFFVSILVTK